MKFIVNFLVFIEVYGCQMNVSDTEIVFSILSKHNYKRTNNLEEADVILLVTCAIRDGAEQKIWNRLAHLKSIKINKRKKFHSNVTIGVLGN